MPISVENRSRYPSDWPDISRAVKERAGWQCANARASAEAQPLTKDDASTFTANPPVKPDPGSSSPSHTWTTFRRTALRKTFGQCVSGVT